MPPDMQLGIAISVIGYLLLFATGVNGIRHSRIMGLGFDGYIMSSIWLWFGVSGMVNTAFNIQMLMTKGMPVAILFPSGEVMPFPGLGYRRWATVAVGMVIIVGLFLRSWVMVRNAKVMKAEARLDVARTNRAMLSLKRTIDAGR